MNRKPKKLPRVVADWLRFVSVNMKLSGFSGRLSPKIEEHALRLYREGKLKPRKPLSARTVLKAMRSEGDTRSVGMKKQTIGTKIGAEVRRKANKFSAAKRARLMKRGMEIMRCPDLVAMRAWKGERVITRTIVLSVCLDQLMVPGGLQDWLERRRSDLDGESPVGLIKRGEWTVLADLIDDMLTGAPS